MSLLLYLLAALFLLSGSFLWFMVRANHNLLTQLVMHPDSLSPEEQEALCRALRAPDLEAARLIAQRLLHNAPFKRRCAGLFLLLGGLLLFIAFFLF